MVAMRAIPSQPSFHFTAPGHGSSSSCTTFPALFTYRTLFHPQTTQNYHNNSDDYPGPGEENYAPTTSVNKSNAPDFKSMSSKNLAKSAKAANEELLARSEKDEYFMEGYKRLPGATPQRPIPIVDSEEGEVTSADVASPSAGKGQAEPVKRGRGRYSATSPNVTNSEFPSYHRPFRLSETGKLIYAVGFFGVAFTTPHARVSTAPTKST